MHKLVRQAAASQVRWTGAAMSMCTCQAGSGAAEMNAPVAPPAADSEKPRWVTHQPMLPRESENGINLNQSNPCLPEMPRYSLQAIGTIESVFREKFGTPRQGKLAPTSRARLRLGLVNNGRMALDGLQEFTHVWIVFMFSLNVQHKVCFRIRPPRLNGAKMGVLATRSPHRPNPVGLSLAKIEGVDLVNGILHLSGVDLVSGTPVLDVKPYLPMHDAPPVVARVPDWIDQPAIPDGFQISFTSEALRDIDYYVASGKLDFYDNASDLRTVIEDVLSMLQSRTENEPRSAYRRMAEPGVRDDRNFGFCVDVLNVKIRYADDNMSVSVQGLDDWSDRYYSEGERKKKKGLRPPMAPNN